MFGKNLGKKKMGKEKALDKKIICGVELSLYLISIFAFAFILGGGNLVSGRGDTETVHSTNNVREVKHSNGTVSLYSTKAGIYTVGNRRLQFPEGACITCSGLGGDWSKVSFEDSVAKPNTKPSVAPTPAGGAPALDEYAKWRNIATKIAERDGIPPPTTGETPDQYVNRLEGLRAEGKIPPNTNIDNGALGPQGPLGDPGQTNQAGKAGDIFSNAGDGLLQGLLWGGIGFGAGQMLGSLLGFNSDQTLALSAGLGAGAFAYQFAGSLGLEGVAQLGVGLGVGALVFILMYKDVEVKIVTFECNTWQAPHGGNDCEICNEGTLPCSEYRCRSLGQNCEIVNPGTEQERCVNVNPQDVNPPTIMPNELDLTFGHNYTEVKNSPPGPGFKIKRMDSTDGCLKAFTPLKFGVITNEPAQCKIDFNHTTTFDAMASYMGGNNMYLYNHTEIFALPGAKAFEGSPFVLDNGKDLNFFIRCQDKNGNFNSAEYNVRFCMDPTPDTTAPIIKATSIINNGCVAEGVNNASVEFYTDEPADCKWSHVDQSYENMQNNMACSMNLYQINAEKLFTCKANLTGIARDNTDFYVRCKDQPGMQENNRNKNGQSFKFSLHGSGALKMRNTRPNETIFGSVSPAPVELYTETLFGCDAGKAVCYYSRTGNLNDYITFFDTNKKDGIHTQRQDVAAGSHQYFVKCVDSGGNAVNQTVNFTVDIDTSAPVVARAYEESGNLKIVTVRNSQCSYTSKDCDFTFEEGTEMPFANTTTHVAEWKNDKTYYIKCRDQFRNEEAGCSIIVRPSRDLF